MDLRCAPGPESCLSEDTVWHDDALAFRKCQPIGERLCRSANVIASESVWVGGFEVATLIPSFPMTTTPEDLDYLEILGQCNERSYTNLEHGKRVGGTAWRA